MALPDFLYACDGNGHTDGALRPDTGSVVTVASGASSASSAALSHDLVEVTATLDCYIAIGSAPTASATTMYLPASLPRLFHILNGTDKIAAIKKSSDGVVHIVPMK